MQESRYPATSAGKLVRGEESGKIDETIERRAKTQVNQMSTIVEAVASGVGNVA